jgi:hypothetical protein
MHAAAKECTAYVELERVAGIEPASQAWEAWVIPIYDTRNARIITPLAARLKSRVGARGELPDYRGFLRIHPSQWYCKHDRMRRSGLCETRVTCVYCALCFRRKRCGLYPRFCSWGNVARPFGFLFVSRLAY